MPHSFSPTDSLRDQSVSLTDDLKSWLGRPQEFFEYIDLLPWGEVTCVIRKVLYVQKRTKEAANSLQKDIEKYVPAKRFRTSIQHDSPSLGEFRLLVVKKRSLLRKSLCLQQFLNGIFLSQFCNRLIKTLPLEIREWIHLYILASCHGSNAFLPFNFILQAESFFRKPKDFSLPIVADKYLVGSNFFRELTITWYRNTTVKYCSLDRFIRYIHTDRWNSNLDPARYLHRVVIHYTIFAEPDEKELRKGLTALRLFKEISRPNAKLKVIMEPPVVNPHRKYKQHGEIKTSCHSFPTVRQDGKPDEVAQWSETRQEILVQCLRNELGGRCRCISFVTYSMTLRSDCIYCYPDINHIVDAEKYNRCIYEETMEEFIKRERLPKGSCCDWIA